MSNKLFEWIYERANRKRLVEMAYLGNIEHGRNYIIFTYNREFPNEEPHINLGNYDGSQIHAKIEIPLEEPESVSDFEVLKHHKKLHITSRLKKKILLWYKSYHKTGIKNWKMALSMWEAAIEAKKVGQL